MTMVQSKDGARSQRPDYLDLATELADVSAAADADLAALWRRVAFFVAIHNTDDHLRNHGLLRDGSGWRLSPVFDVNPNPDVAQERVTAIGTGRTRTDEIDGLLLAAPVFGLSDARARAILSEVVIAIAPWRDVATANGIPDSGLRRFEETFEGLRDELTARSARSLG